MSQTSPPYSPPPGTRTVIGRVLGDIGGIPTAVAGAVVGFEADSDVFAAWTVTDAAGRFLLCGLPTTQLQLSAYSALANAANVAVGAGGDAMVDIEVQ